MRETMLPIMKLDDLVIPLDESVEGLNLTPYQREIVDYAKLWYVTEEEMSFFTSGSTGDPQEIKFSKTECSASAMQTIKFFGLDKETIVWLCLPIKYVAARMMIIRALIAQCHILTSTPAASPKLPSLTVDFTPLTPMILSRLLDKYDFLEKKIRHILTGGSPLSPEMERRCIEAKLKVTEGYGMTETLTQVATREVSPQSERGFKMMNPSSFSLDDGRICLHVPYLHTSPVLTNDIGRMVGEDRFIIVGRADDVINTGGVKINPTEIENLLSPFLGRDFILVGVPDDELGQRLTLVIEGGKSDKLNNELKEIIDRELSGLQKPKEIYYLADFLRTDSGKPKRKEISYLIQNNTDE